MQALTFFFAFVAVLGLIGLAAWLVRRFAGNRLGASTNRGRMPRLAVIDAAAVDGRRRLVLVRRDNVEHLLMIGGPTDIVVEPNIVRAVAARDQLPQRSGELTPRIAPLPDVPGWSDGDGARAETFGHNEPQMPEPPPRPARPSFSDEVRRAAPTAPERRSDPLTGFAPEPIGGRPEPRGDSRADSRADSIAQRLARTEPMVPRAQRSSEPKPAAPVVRAPERAAAPAVPPQAPIAPVAPVAPPPQTADQNLAEMAQRLEAALRRPAPDTLAPPVAPDAPARSPRVDAPASPAKNGSEKSGFENLEDEMASLLGRPKPPS
jgi:hypothetical protein